MGRRRNAPLFTPENREESLAIDGVISGMAPTAGMGIRVTRLLFPNEFTDEVYERGVVAIFAKTRPAAAMV